MSNERRNALRKATQTPIEVIDSVTGRAIGRIGNLSRNGMMLICHKPLCDDALYQLRFRLTGASADIEAGVHTMWIEQATTSGYQWSGLRIISISAPDADLLDRWLDEDLA